MSVKQTVGAWLLSKKGKNTAKTEAATKESYAVRALKRQITVQQQIINDLSDQLSQLSKIASYNRDQNMQEKLLDLAVQFFAPSVGGNTQQLSANPTQSRQVRLESGSIKYDDDSLKSQIASLDPSVQSLIATAPLSMLKKKVRSIIPNMSDESVERAQEIAQELIQSA